MYTTHSNKKIEIYYQEHISLVHSLCGTNCLPMQDYLPVSGFFFYKAVLRYLTFPDLHPGSFAFRVNFCLFSTTDAISISDCSASSDWTNAEWWLGEGTGRSGHGLIQKPYWHLLTVPRTTTQFFSHGSRWPAEVSIEHLPTVKFTSRFSKMPAVGNDSEDWIYCTLQIVFHSSLMCKHVKKYKLLKSCVTEDMVSLTVSGDLRK